MRATKRRRVFLVDDHPIVQQGLTMLIDAQSNLQVCGQSATAGEALRTIASVGPDVVIVDLSLKGSSGLGLIKELHVRHPKLAILVLSMHDETLFAERALRAGALGYVMKQEPGSVVLSALRKVLKGELYVSDRVSQMALNSLRRGAAVGVASPVGQLSDRELEVLELIGRGLKTGEIAQTLHISVKTVQSHRANLKSKLHLEDSGKLALYASARSQGV
jgi:DNA-binding NarL/FixJ family response regulator